MTTAFTPGPWKVGKNSRGDCRIYSPTEDHAIARTYGPDLNGIGVCELTGIKNKADARLIAAAPDLLEALITCAETFHKYAYHHRVKDPVKADSNLQLARLCESAIAKATGDV